MNRLAFAVELLAHREQFVADSLRAEPERLVVIALAFWSEAVRAKR